LSVRARGGKTVISWQGNARNQIRQWVVQTRTGGRWTTIIVPGTEFSRTFKDGECDAVAVTAVNRFGGISTAAVARL
jgi:hypothetical protein